MLQNLHDVAVNARQRYRDEFDAGEVVLTDAFKDAFGISLRRDHQDVDFTAHTAVVTTSGNLKMYIPNQWFCAAAFMVPFVTLYCEYRAITDDYFANAYGSATERKAIIKDLKESDNPVLVENFKNGLRARLDGRVPANELEETVRLVSRFVSDYDWWFGNKTIDRSDTYVSPILALLGVVNASQSYIAEICYKYATEPALTVASQQMIDLHPVVNQGTDQQPVVVDANRLVGGINEIVYGAPGTGKSKYLDDTYAATTIAKRVVFHPEYTIFDFVGTYKPIPIYKTGNDTLHTLGGEAVTRGEPIIDYQFVPGPFITCLVDAWLDPTHMHTLIIEEINRANTAAVFGEVFQLLDRNINGTSEYSIEPSYDLKQYLLSIDGMDQYLEGGLRIPSNMNIVATMNSSDQGVMPMDSAFKRRWSFMYVRIAIEGAVHENATLLYGGREVTWGNLVRAINLKLIGLGFEEDRLIGPYFIKPEEIGNRRATDKLLLYLWDDVLRHNHDSFFNSQIKTFADLSENFPVLDVFDLMIREDTAAFLTAQIAGNEQNEENAEEE